MAAPKLNKKQVIAALNEILEHELAGVIKYTHYSFMIFGHHRIPIIGWMKEQATESLTHAYQAGEHVTSLGGNTSLKVGTLLPKTQSEIDRILKDSLAHERKALDAYGKLLDLVKDRSIVLEEYARGMIAAETTHVTEVEKMLGKPR